MNTEILERIKKASVEALRGRKQLEKTHIAYMEKLHAGRITRKQTTTYNAKTADIMENSVSPNEKYLKEVLR